VALLPGLASDGSRSGSSKPGDETFISARPDSGHNGTVVIEASGPELTHRKP
jgi:hypothetical protein